MTGLLRAAMTSMVLMMVAAPTAQQPAASQRPAPTFEVVSITSNKSGDPLGTVRWLPGGRLIAVNMPLRDLIHYAYQVRPFQIDGVPGWAATERYDITAKATADVPSIANGLSQVQMQLLRTLLADRFKMATHTETREQPIYALTVARPDGRLGAQLTASTTDCAALTQTPTARGGLSLLTPGARVQCGLMIGPQRISAGGIGLDELASALVGLVQRTVLDRTGLAGKHDVELTFQGEALLGPGFIPPPENAAAQNLPSLFTAIQEQLGLKLEATKGPAPVLVVDRVEHATDN